MSNGSSASSAAGLEARIRDLLQFPLSLTHGLAAGELEIKVAGAVVDAAGLVVAVLDAGDRQHLAVVARREHLVGVEDVLPGQRRLLDLGAGRAQQLDHALAR